MEEVLKCNNEWTSGKYNDSEVVIVETKANKNQGVV